MKIKRINKYLIFSWLGPISMGVFLASGVLLIDMTLPAVVNENIKRTFSLDYLYMSPGVEPATSSGVNIRPRQYSLVFLGLARDDFYDNFFQSGNKHSVQLELQHPGQLFVKIGDAFVFKVSNKIELNRWYKYELKGSIGDYVRFYIDGALVFETTRSEVVSQQLDFSNIKFGTGYGDQRRLQGELKELVFEASGITSPIWLKPALSATGFVCALIWITFFLTSTNGMKLLVDFKASIRLDGPQVELLSIFLLVSGGAIWLMATGILQTKWAVLTAMGFAVGASPFIKFGNVVKFKYMRVPLAILSLSGVLSLGFILWKNPRIIDQGKDVQIALATIICLVPLIFLIFKVGIKCNFSALEFIRALLFFALLIVCCLTLADLQSWQLYSTMLTSQPAMATFLAITGASLALYISLRVIHKANDDSNSNEL